MNTLPKCISAQAHAAWATPASRCGNPTRRPTRLNGLEEIHIDSPVPPVHEQNDDHFDIVDDDFFFGGKEFKEELRKQFYSEVRLYVPESAVEAYREAPVWKNFTHINDKEYNGIDDIMPKTQYA